MLMKHLSSARLLAAVLAMCAVIGCALPFTEAASPTPSSEPTGTLLPTLAPIQPTESPSATPTGAAAPLEGAEPTTAPTGEAAAPTPQASTGPAGTEVPPTKGSFDVYLGPPNDQGFQLLRWVSTNTGEKVTEISIRTDDEKAVRAGRYIYFYASGTRAPQRVNTSGIVQPVTFANPPAGAQYYQFLPSATGDYLAWVVVQSDSVYRIYLSDADGTDVRQVGGDTLVSGETIRLLRVTNDGSRIFYERRPPGIAHEPLIPGKYEIHVLTVASSVVSTLPDEPACGETLVCDAHISPDGAIIIRTLPPSRFAQPVVVTNVMTSSVLARFAPLETPGGFTVDIGYPFLTPGGEMVYLQAYGPANLEQYRLVWANIVTGEQRVVAELGYDQHRPLGWAADGITLLTTREPAMFDTWQINVETGEMRQIAGMLFLGHIEEPPLTP
jgi:hypothetical protein